MQTQTFRRDDDGLLATVRAVDGAPTYEVDIEDRGGYVFTEEFSECEPRSAAAQAMAMHDNLLGMYVAGPAGLLDFKLTERVKR